MNLNEVKLQLKKYRKVLKKVNQNRADWKPKPKILFYNTLSTIIKKYKNESLGRKRRKHRWHGN